MGLDPSPFSVGTYLYYVIIQNSELINYSWLSPWTYSFYSINIYEFKWLWYEQASFKISITVIEKKIFEQKVLLHIISKFHEIL